MAKETVTIGCKLPAGLKLEIGYEINEKDGSQRRLPSYQVIVLKGWHAHTESQRQAGLQLPAGMDMRPFLNRNVDKAAWEQWKSAHANSWLLRNEILFEAKDEASAQLRVLEGAKTPAPFAPLNPKKPAPGVEVADFATARG